MIDEWSNDIKVIKRCDMMPSEPVQIIFSRKVQRKIHLLMEKYKNIEWLAYLIGTDYVVDDLFIPNQEVTSVSINVLSPLSNKECLGVIHSHHNMGAFFSKTDEDYINSNHDVSIVVSTKGMLAQARKVTPCGAIILLPAIVIPEEENTGFNETDFINLVDLAVSPAQISTGMIDVDPRKINENVTDIGDPVFEDYKDYDDRYQFTDNTFDETDFNERYDMIMSRINKLKGGNRP